jgi:hypothetical protein
LACITVGIFFRFLKYKDTKNDFNNFKKYKLNSNTFVTFSNLGEVLAKSITSATSTILLIGGFIVIFSSIISILKASGFLTLLIPLSSFLGINANFVQGLFTGFLEITNGISTIASIPCKKLTVNLVLTAFLLGFGGISVLLQVLSITSKTDLSIKPYILGKILHGFLASFYTFVFIQVFPFFNFDL